MVTHKTDTMNLSINIGATFVKDTYEEDFSALLSLADKALYSTVRAPYVAKTDSKRRGKCLLFSFRCIYLQELYEQTGLLCAHSQLDKPKF